MFISPLEQSPEWRSAIDRFCTQTLETGKQEAERRVRSVASALGVVCLALLLSLGFATWRANAAELERDALANELRLERAARIKAGLAAKDVEMSAARYSLDTRVRRDIVDERMVQQEQRSAELDQLAANVERERTIKADCVTPRSGIASGL